MKIIKNSTGENLRVYGIYTSNKGPILCVSPKDYYGILVVGIKDVVVVDNNIDSDFVFFMFESGEFGVFCKLLIQENILDDLLELEPSAYQRFVDYLGQDP